MRKKNPFLSSKSAKAARAAAVASAVDLNNQLEAVAADLGGHPDALKKVRTLQNLNNQAGEPK